MSDDIKRIEKVHAINFDHYHHEEIYMSVNQNVDPENPLCNIEEAYFLALAKSIRNYN